MYENSLVSILIPLYNTERYISETIESCLNQTYKNIEIIIVDDGSTDNSLVIAKKYEKNHKNIKVFTQINSGAQKARNLAFEKSIGEYIQYLDADDLLSKDKISSQMSLVEQQGNKNIYTTKFVRFKDDINKVQYTKKTIDRSFESGIEWLIASWSGAGMGAISIWLTPRDLIEKAGKWNESLSKNQDGEFFCRTLLHSNKVIYSYNGCVYYRETGSDSISQQMTRKAAEATLLSYQLYEEHVKHIDSSKLRKALAYNYLSFINHFYPKFPTLIKEAEDHIKALGYSYASFYLPGKLFYLSKWIGFKNALRLREMIRCVLLKKEEHDVS
jgi:glycosyltransferase involved in cell wall biosynthesis